MAVAIASLGFNKAPLFLIGVDAAKERVYSRLRVTEPGAGLVCAVISNEW